MKKIISLVVVASLALAGKAEITLPKIFSDGMVMQQNSNVPIWGHTSAEKGIVKIKTSWNKKTISITADKDGCFKASITTPSAGGPYSITLSDGKELIISNILMGEVWLASGQSNMNMTMEGCYRDPVLGGLEDIVDSNDEELRYYEVKPGKDFHGIHDCTGSWKSAGPETTASFSATAYYFARRLRKTLKVPVGIVMAAYGGSRIEAWMSKDATDKFEGRAIHNPYCMYDDYIRPIVGYSIKGLIWYQGEANRDEPDLYEELMPAFIKNWRELWNCGEFPFYYAQIAPFNYGDGNQKGKNSAYIRDVQRKVEDKIPNAAMAVLTDIDSYNTIHPSNKKPAGDRLAFLALSDTYGMTGFPSHSPRYTHFTVEGKKINVYFDNIGQGLTSWRKNITDFEVCGDDHVFHPAKAHFGPEHRYVVVECDDVTAPVAVRYGFTNTPHASIFNMMGLPASTFRTDDF